MSSNTNGSFSRAFEGAPATAKPSDLRDDTRGLLLIFAIGAGLLLAGATYELAQIGYACVLRSTAQNAADVAAENASVYQARGMNVLVYLNLIMSVIMACLIVWRVLLGILTLAAIAATVVCFVSAGTGCPLAVRLDQAEVKALKRDRQVSEWIAKACAAVNVVEKLVATVIPPYASVRASADVWGNKSYKANWAFAFTPTLAPRIMDKSSPGALFKNNGAKLIKEKLVDCLKSAKKKPDLPKDNDVASHRRPSRVDWKKVSGSWETWAQRRMGLWVSLPVQEDRLGKLCGEASKWFDRIIAQSVGSQDFGSVTQFKSLVFSWVPSLFCAPSKEAVQAEVDGINRELKNQAKQGCVTKKEEFDKLSRVERRKHEFFKNGGFDSKKCETKTEKDIREKHKGPDAARKQMDDVLKCVKPAKVWEIARNGNPMLYSFSLVSVPSSSGRFFAQAEMYFDCTGGWVSGCDPNAMWLPNWKARVVHVRSWPDMFGELGASVFSASVANGLQKLLGEKLYARFPMIGTDAKYGNIFNGSDFSTHASPKDNWLGRNGVQDVLREIANWPLQRLDGDGSTQQVDAAHNQRFFH